MKCSECNHCSFAELSEKVSLYHDSSAGWSYDYDTVIENLESAQDTISHSLRCPRPTNLPANIPWSERPYDPDEEFNPYVYNGSMSEDDYDLLHEDMEMEMN